MNSTNHQGNAAKIQQVGLRHYLTRFLHITVNVSELERSTKFYEEVFRIKRRERIDGPAQRYGGLGIDRGQCEGWVLRDASEFPARAIHLVEWKTPKPIGKPYAEANHVGFYRCNALMRESGLRGAYERGVALGGKPYGPVSRIILDTQGVEEGPVFAMRDPDGATLEFSNEPMPPEKDRLHHVAAYCTDLRRSYAFYRDVVGLDLLCRLNPNPQPVTNGSFGDFMRNADGSEYKGDTYKFDAVLMKYRADARNPLDLVEMQAPPPHGKPYESPVNLGIQSLAFEVDDIDAAYEALIRALPDHKTRVAGPPEVWDLGGAGKWKVVNFTDPDGLRLQIWQPWPPYSGERAVEPI